MVFVTARSHGIVISFIVFVHAVSLFCFLFVSGSTQLGL